MRVNYTDLPIGKSIDRLEALRAQGHRISILRKTDGAEFQFEKRTGGREIGFKIVGHIAADSQGVFIDARPHPKIVGLVVFGLLCLVSLLGGAWRSLSIFAAIYLVGFTIEATMAFQAIRKLYKA